MSASPAPAGPPTPAAGPAAAPAGPLVPPRDLAKLALLGALVGLPAGLVAFLFITVVHELQHWLFTDLPEALGADEPPWYLLVGLPLVGAVVVLLARRLPGDGGHAPIGGVSLSPGHPREALSITLAAIGTLGFGIVLGPEAPLIALGSIVGIWVTGWVRMGDRGRAVLGVAGSGAAMSTLFGGPLVSGLMLLEGGIGLGALVIPMLIPALVASAVSYLLVTGLGDWSGIPMAGLQLQGLPAYDDVLVSDLLVAVVVGLLAAAVAAIVRRAATALHVREARVGRGPLLLGSGLVVGLTAVVAGLLGADPQDVLFSGQNSMTPLVTESSAGVVLVLLLGKGVAYVASLGGGFRGGPIFPAMFLGVALATFAVIALDMSATVAVAMGTAAGMAAMTRMILTPVLFAALLVGREGLDAVPAAVLAAAVAWLASAVIDQRRIARTSPDAGEAASAAAPAGTALPDPGRPAAGAGR